MNTPIETRNHRILVIDDNPSIHEDIRKILVGGGQQSSSMASAKALLFNEETSLSTRTEFEIDSAFQGEEGLAKVQHAHAEGRPYAMAFVDVRMPPGWDGVETITRIWSFHPDLQVVICTAYSDYSWEDMIRQIGKSDSLVILKKPFDNIEVLQLAHALTEKWSLNHQVKNRLRDLDQLVQQRTIDLESANEKLKKEIADRMQTEKSLRLSEERFSKAFTASPIPLAIQSLNQEKYVDANAGFQEITGYSREELVGHTPEELQIWVKPEEGAEILVKLRDQLSIRNFGCQLRTQSGQLRDTLLSVELFELDGEPFILTIAQDITEQIKLESQLRQSQKMEAIGQLAAGVAHDFNNILTVIQGHASLMLNKKEPAAVEYKPLKTISAAADRAGKLVRQLLTFSRKQFLQLRSMKLGDTLTAVSEMLPRVLGEHIKVEVLTSPALPLINADAGMMEQMLMNLAVNARDAMLEGGTLTIRTEVVEIPAKPAGQNQDAQPGTFVCLSVSDTGCGIPPEVLPRIFEPFFTTKPVGKGTGLGLATVYGIVKQHKGWIDVQSQAESGTTFQIYIPACEKSVGEESESTSPSAVIGGSESVLVVEDEQPLREFVVDVLRSHGYKVYAAESGVKALEQWAALHRNVDLLVTDMVMPDGVMGRELAARLVAEKPKLKVLYTSGYSPGMAGEDLALLEGRNFLPKPYPPTKLLHLVRECLDQRRPNGR